MLAMWLAHIWMVIYFMPIAYELTGSFNLAFCCNPVLECETSKGFRKKVILNFFWKKFFCGYDNHGNMIWLMLFYQCLLLIYICAFILLNVIFVVDFIINNTNSTIWIKIWFFEIVTQYVIFAIVMISSYLKDIYLWAKERKLSPSPIKKRNICENDIGILEARKIAKQKNKIVAFLKQYGLFFDRHKYYLITSVDLKIIEEALQKEFPQLYIVLSQNEGGKQFFKIHHKKYQHSLVLVYIKSE